MDISKHSFVTVNEILSDVLKQVDDERYEINSRGYYVSLVQQALEGLAFDTFFDVKREDFQFPKDDLRLEMPIGAFNVRHIYIYNGDKCVIGSAQKVWWKRNYYPAKKGTGYFADNRGNNVDDPFFPSNTLGRDALMVNGQVLSPSQRSTVDHSYFYNIQNGVIMFSSICRSYSMVHVEYNGTGCELGDIPIIPMFLREAVQDFVAESTLRIRMAKEPRVWGPLWQIYEQRLNRDEKYGIGVGSWRRAAYRVKTLSASKRSDFYEYYGRSQWEAGF